MNEYTPFDPESMKTETQNKKISGKLIDKFWEPLNEENQIALDRILQICLNKAVDRYHNDPEKMASAREFLTHNWILDANYSFNKRLKSTKLPKRSTMHAANPQLDENEHIMNFDILANRKRRYETLLAAEIKQIETLKKNHKKVKLNYESDLAYLNEFKKTVAANQSKMTQDITTVTPQIKAKPDSKPINFKVKQDFVPKQDDDINELLQELNSDLKSLSSKTKVFTEFNEKLQDFQNYLDML